MNKKYAEWRAKTGARLVYRELVAKYADVPDVAELTQLSVAAYAKGDKRQLRRIHDRTCKVILRHLVEVAGVAREEGIRVLFGLEYAFSVMLPVIK